MESKGKGDGTPPRVQEDDSADKRARTSGAPIAGGEEEDGDVAMGKEGDEEDKDEVEDEDTDEGEDDNMEEDEESDIRTKLFLDDATAMPIATALGLTPTDNTHNISGIELLHILSICKVA